MSFEQAAVCTFSLFGKTGGLVARGLLFQLFLCTNVLIFSKACFAQQALDPVAERMLLYQRNNGGWPQPGDDAIDYSRELTLEQKNMLVQNKAKLDATIDDRATTREINYLVGAYQQTQNDRYPKAAEAGIRYLLTAQKTNGGWAQFYPNSSGYRKQITYNDNAMIDVPEVMQSTAEATGDFGAVDKALVPLAQRAVERGVA